MEPNSHISPFISEHSDLTVGLNQLGLRNAPEMLFTTLLRGLNNVTSRIRYYSFYCWLMDAFCSPHASVDPKQQPKFIRRAEYLLALIQTQTNDARGIPGINYASAKAKKLDTLSFDLQKGTYNGSGGTRTGTYFANPGGVFAQYYARSLNDIKLIGENEVASKKNKLYVATTGEGFLNGKTLANAFSASIGADNSSLFLQCVDNGVVSRDQLGLLKESFRMKSFADAKEERDLLIQLLLQEDFRASDEATYYRKNTLLLFLEYIKNQPGIDHNVAFPEYVYHQYLKAPSEDPVYFGWYSYYLDDNYQYQASILLKYILKVLDTAPYEDLWVDLETLVCEMTKGITDVLLAHGYSGTVEQVCSLLKNGEPQWRDSGAYPEMAAALLNLFYQSTVNEPYLESIINIQARCFAMSGMDDFSRFIQLFREQARRSIGDFIHDFLEKQIIRKHFRVALRKYHQTGIASYKFLLEDGYIRFLDSVDATHMDSRIDTVADFLRELELYDINGLLPLGEKCLKMEGRL